MFDITLSQLPAGHADHVIPDSHYGWILVKEFTSTEDGQDFVKRLEGIVDFLRRQLPEETHPSQIDHLLAIIHRDRTAQIFVNEIPINAQVRVAKPVDAGQPVMKGDIVDIARLDLGVVIPQDAGVVFLFSIGWRKGLLYDLVPLGGPSSTERDYDIDAYLGRMYGYVLFQERHSLSEVEWERLLKEKWFPFIGLPESSIGAMLSQVRSGKRVDDVLPEIVSNVSKRLPEILDSWKQHPTLSHHMPFLERAVERFGEQDYISCSTILFTKIEGIIRTHRIQENEPGRATQGKMVESAVRREITDAPHSLLFPKRFADYLTNQS